MSDDRIGAVMSELAPAVRKGDVASCETLVVEQLHSLPPSPFHVVLDLSIRNDPADAARHFDRFFESERKRFAIAAAYTEMNGFYINPGRWYCDLFAYASDGGHEDYDWLSDWQSDEFEDYTIHGLEELQAVYAGPPGEDRKLKTVREFCDLLVVIRFQRFIQIAAPAMKQLSFPLFVTAHDYDFIAKFRPPA
jgi:hypothetical protein